MPALPIIVIAQLFGTSLWFSANAAGDDLMRAWQLVPADLGRLTNAVQLGFILGTLGFSLTGLADRFPASRIFALCALLGAAANAGFALFANGMESALPPEEALCLFCRSSSSPSSSAPPCGSRPTPPATT